MTSQHSQPLATRAREKHFDSLSAMHSWLAEMAKSAHGVTDEGILERTGELAAMYATALGGPDMCKSTLPRDSEERKRYPLFRGLLRYFPAALAGVSNLSIRGNEKHNPGEEMHHARSKSSDHADCILRHLIDLAELQDEYDRTLEPCPDQIEAILTELDSIAWRALALSQVTREKMGEAPMAPGALE